MAVKSKLTKEEWDSLVVIARKLDIDLGNVKVESSTFAEMEEIAHRLGQAMARATSERLAAERADDARPRYECPTCGQVCTTNVRDRSFTTIDGPIELQEPSCHCSACRRDFFPSASSNAARSKKL